MTKHIIALMFLGLLAIELALKNFLKNSNKKHARIFSDNTTAVTCINKQERIKLLSRNETAKRIWEFCIHNITHIWAAHIPVKQSISAGLTSSKFHDSAVWMLEPRTAQPWFIRIMECEISPPIIIPSRFQTSRVQRETPTLSETSNIGPINLIH